jgi:IS30 family transposase
MNHIVHSINSLPRKRLNYKSADSVFQAKLRSSRATPTD